MDSTNTALFIITVVSGVMNIILFFKIWGMTNDIDDFHKFSIPGEDSLSFLIGDNRYEAAYRRCCIKADVAYDTLTQSPDDKAAKKTLEDVHTALKFIGRELPPYLRSFEAYHEYKLFSSKTYRIACEKQKQEQNQTKA